MGTLGDSMCAGSRESKIIGQVYLVGAGPGDPELLTLRARRCLAAADAVLYDALVHPDILHHCRDDAQRVFVGKRAGQPSIRQSRINEQLIALAHKGLTVVRLKGGDPFLFGRGSEEAEVLAAAEIPFEIVPGVPSSTAAPAYAGMSLTHRDLASSVAYCTATESSERSVSHHDWAKLATATQTLVIFMGMRKLDALMDTLIRYGRDPQTPAAVIHSASTPAQRTLVGTVATIAQQARAAKIGMPSLTIVGDVVNLRQSLRWYDTKPLFAKAVLVTRPAHQASALSQLLRDEGAEPIEIAPIQISAPDDMQPLERAVGQLADYDWLLFTSANGVRFFFATLHAQGLDSRALGSAKLAVIGTKTAQALAYYGLVADVCPNEFRAEALAEAIMDQFPSRDLRGLRFLLPRAAKARETLISLLEHQGAQVDVVSAYQTLPASKETRDVLRQRFQEGHIDVVTFTASSTVSQLVECLGEHAQTWLNRCFIASIGPITTATALELGLRVDVTARQYTLEGLRDALVAAQRRAL